MKYCTHCGKELLDEAVICMGCGCATGTYQPQQAQKPTVSRGELLNTLSQRLNVNGIIWLVIGILQIIGGIFWNWYLLIVGALNIISAVKDMRYSKELLVCPGDIVARFDSLVGPIITLVYNVVFGGLIGVAGSIYYFVAIRKYVMENKQAFASLNATTKPAAQSAYSVVTAPAGKPIIPPAGRWICQYCATENSNNYSQCKKCGKFRGSI